LFNYLNWHHVLWISVVLSELYLVWTFIVIWIISICITVIFAFSCSESELYTKPLLIYGTGAGEQPSSVICSVAARTARKNAYQGYPIQTIQVWDF
jgi:hypothetical protein